jgi:hypothetical protein
VGSAAARLQLLSGHGTQPIEEEGQGHQRQARCDHDGCRRGSAVSGRAPRQQESVRTRWQGGDDHRHCQIFILEPRPETQDTYRDGHNNELHECG